MKKYIPFALGLLATGTATVAYARMHTNTERDGIVAKCKLVAETKDIKPIVPGLRDSGASEEDVDYALDMCFSYNSGMIAGLQKAQEIYAK